MRDGSAACVVRTPAVASCFPLVSSCFSEGPDPTAAVVVALQACDGPEPGVAAMGDPIPRRTVRARARGRRPPFHPNVREKVNPSQPSACLQQVAAAAPALAGGEAAGPLKRRGGLRTLEEARGMGSC